MTILEPSPMEVISRLRAHIREWGFQAVSKDILWYDGLRKVLPQAAAVSGVWNVVVIRSGADGNAENSCPGGVGYWSRENGLDTRTLCTSAGDVRTLEYYRFTRGYADRSGGKWADGGPAQKRKRGQRGAALYGRLTELHSDGAAVSQF